MDIFSWIRLFLRNWKYTFLLPIIAAAFTVFLTKDISRTFKSNALLYTAVGTGYDVLSDPTSKIDRFGTIVNFDNLVSTINSRTCLETATLKLLAWRLTTNVQITTKEWREEDKLLASKLSPEILKLARQVTEAEMYEYLNIAYQTKSDIPLITFIETVPSNYNIDRIRTTLRVKQRLSSDMLELIYTSNIPIVTKKTLDFLISSFREAYLGLKSKEAQNVVDYYEKQLNKASNDLKLAEERAKNFSTENRIINFNEQSKNLANAKEETQAELYQQENIKVSSQEAIDNIENQIGDQQSLYLFNKEIKPTNARLSELNNIIASREMFGDTADARYKELKREYAELEENTRKRLRKYASGSESGMDRASLMTKWLDNILDLNKANARIKVIKARLQSFDKTFEEYAPLGYTIDQLSREAEIAKQAYIAMLKAYNTAVLKLKDTQITNALSIVDAPFLPQNAQPSKRMQMVILAALVTFFLVAGILIVVTYLDTSIKSIENIKKLTGNEVIAAVPFYDEVNSEINWSDLRKTQQLNIGNSILAYFAKHVKENRTKFIGITSNLAQEGKHFIAEMLQEELLRIGFSVRSFSPEHHPGFTQYDPDILHRFLNLPKADHEKASILNNLGSIMGIEGSEDFVIFIFPNFTNNEIPLPLLNSLDTQLKVIDANRSWTKSDDYLHQLNQEENTSGLFIILNSMSPWDVEEIYGEIPRKISWSKKLLNSVIRTFFKRNLSRS